MNTLIKFTFINGIELFIAALLLSFIVIYICYWLGDRQNKKDYEKDYNYLKLLVENFDDKSWYNIAPHLGGNNSLLKKEIKRRFDEISKYSCKNYEKLQVLERTFDKKFAK